MQQDLTRLQIQRRIHKPKKDTDKEESEDTDADAEEPVKKAKSDKKLGKKKSKILKDDSRFR